MRVFVCCARTDETDIPPGCNSEQKAAEVLGYNQFMWDNLSGNETQPASHVKHWAELTVKERAAAVLLGYNQKAWDNESGSEPQPVSANMYWVKLTTCGKHVVVCMHVMGTDSDCVSQPAAKLAE